MDFALTNDLIGLVIEHIRTYCAARVLGSRISIDLQLYRICRRTYGFCCMISLLSGIIGMIGVRIPLYFGIAGR